MPSLLALLSSLVWGTSDYFGGSLSRRRPPIAVIGGSQVIGAALTITFAVVAGKWDLTHHSVLLCGVASGIFGLMGLITFYSALSTGMMGIVSPIASVGVIIPLCIGLLRGEQPSGLQYSGIIIAIVGIVLASGPELNSKATARPVVLAIITAVMFGIAIYFMAQGGHDGNPLMTVATMRIVQVTILTIVAVALRSIGGLTKSDIPMLALIGVTDGTANILFSFAALTGMLSIVSVLGSLYPVVTVLLAWIFLKERLQPIQYVGIIATFIGVISITAG